MKSHLPRANQWQAAAGSAQYHVRRQLPSARLLFYFLYDFLLDPQGGLPEELGFLRLFRFVTFRAAGAAATAFLVMMVFSPIFIHFLRKLNAMGRGRDPGNENKDEGVPTMGGLLIIVAVINSIFIWARWDNGLVFVFGMLLIALGAVGFVDDFLKVAKANISGLAGKWKLVAQVLIGALAVYALHRLPEAGEHVQTLYLPFFKQPVIEDLALWLAILFGAAVVTASSNAVNLTDGKDGLAIGCTVICTAAYGVFAYICGHRLFADHLLVPHVAGAGEVVVIVGAICGAGLGFLWYNCFPASMYMGDTGSLALGGAVGLIAVLVKQELLLLVIGGVFVLEAASVILQVGCSQLSRRLFKVDYRPFRCTPYHHHLDRGDNRWADTQIVIRFWIVALLFAAIGVATLKLR